jgi:hypothetical protein
MSYHNPTYYVKATNAANKELTCFVVQTSDILNSHFLIKYSRLIRYAFGLEFSEVFLIEVFNVNAIIVQSANVKGRVLINHFVNHSLFGVPNEKSNPDKESCLSEKS